MNINEQIFFLRGAIVELKAKKHPAWDAYEAILMSLLKLKAQEDLIDQQADELISDVNLPKDLKAFQRIGREDRDKFALEMDQYKCNGGLFEGMYIIPKASILNEVIDAQSKEIAEIKGIVHAIANKMGIADGKIEEVKTKIDPAIIALVGDLATKTQGEILMVHSSISNDIAILEGLFIRGGMTVGERDGILDNMSYQTTDLNLLHLAAEYKIGRAHV